MLFRPRPLDSIAESQLSVPLRSLPGKRPSPSPAVGQIAAQCVQRTDRIASTARYVLCHCLACLEHRPKYFRRIGFQVQITFLDEGSGTGRSRQGLHICEAPQLLATDRTKLLTTVEPLTKRSARPLLVPACSLSTQSSSETRSCERRAVSSGRPTYSQRRATTTFLAHNLSSSW